MSEILEALILGIVQGLTEFLPVSSSGHLEIMKYLMDDDSLAEQSMLTTVFLHFATAIATIVVFRKDIIQVISNILKRDSNALKFAMYIIISMIPAAIIGVLYDDIIDDYFHRKIKLVSCMLLVTGVLLFISERIRPKEAKMNAVKSFIVGISQAIAILPGISRSGATIATSLILGIDKREAARFSFLMVIPLIFGKIAKDLVSGDFVENMPSGMYLSVGFIAAFITGVLACLFMIKIVQRSKLSYFSIYCFIAGIGMLIYSSYF